MNGLNLFAVYLNNAQNLFKIRKNYVIYFNNLYNFYFKNQYQSRSIIKAKLKKFRKFDSKHYIFSFILIQLYLNKYCILLNDNSYLLVNTLWKMLNSFSRVKWKTNFINFIFIQYLENFFESFELVFVFNETQLKNKTKKIILVKSLLFWWRWDWWLFFDQLMININENLVTILMNDKCCIKSM
jgi:hypothetical protein